MKIYGAFFKGKNFCQQTAENFYNLLVVPKAKKKICVFTVTRPTLIFASDPYEFLHRIRITIFVV